MRLFLLTITALVLLSACSSQKRALPFLPPGKELGETWGEAPSFGYEEPVYTTPEYIAYPLKGSHKLLEAAQAVYQQEICTGGDTRIVLRFVIDETGEMAGVHPMGNINPNCKMQLQQTLKQFKFYPAEHNSKNVSMLSAIPITDRRI